MIEIKNVSKGFEECGRIQALHCLSLKINEGEIFGLVGTNGSGKSTLLRMIAGILKPDKGEVTVDGAGVFENPEIKSKVCFLSDSGYTYPNASASDMAGVYKMYYPGFDMDRFTGMINKIGLDPRRKLRTFSKGMKKQVLVLLGICTNTKYLLCDETFDGLDPVMRQTVKSLFATEMLDRTFTPVIASHSLRELEDICDNIGILHNGSVVLSESLTDLKLGVLKFQCVFDDENKERELLRGVNVLKSEKHGTMMTVVVKGEKKDISEKIESLKPVYYEMMPLSLEEIFIDEMGVNGYDFKNLYS